MYYLSIVTYIYIYTYIIHIFFVMLHVGAKVRCGRFCASEVLLESIIHIYIYISLHKSNQAWAFCHHFLPPKMIQIRAQKMYLDVVSVVSVVSFLQIECPRPVENMSHTHQIRPAWLKKPSVLGENLRCKRNLLSDTNIGNCDVF